MPGDLDPPATYTLAEAIAELKRIGPVYSAATRLVDNGMYNPNSRKDDLDRAVLAARPTAGPTRGGDWPMSNNRELDERVQADWDTIAGSP